MIDYTVSLGNIIQIVVIALGGCGVLWAMRFDIGALKTDVREMQQELKKLGEILVNLADIRGEIKALDHRLSVTEQDIRELRR